MSTRILIVEDEIIVAQDMRLALEDLGYQVIDIVDTAEKVLQAVDLEVPDLIMMDIRIRGEMDGIETAEVLRGRVQVPVVFLTAYADDATLDRAKRIEPFGYLVKPFQERDLHTTIEIALYKHRMERQLAEHNEWFRTVLRSIGDAVVATDGQGRVRFMNEAAQRLTQWHEDEARGVPVQEVLRIRDEQGEERLPPLMSQILRHGQVIRMGQNSTLCTRLGGQSPVNDSGAPIVLPGGEILGAVFVLQDETTRRHLEQEREYLIDNLQQALAEVKTLRKLIPICSVCKKVRDDTGFWKEVEEYIADNTDASFTHGICPDCLRRLYPELSDEILDSE